MSHNKENIERTSKRRAAKAVLTNLVSHDTDSTLTEDEMSVNIINRNKAKLLSHVLNPNKKLRCVGVVGETFICFFWLMPLVFIGYFQGRGDGVVIEVSVVA